MSNHSDMQIDLANDVAYWQWVESQDKGHPIEPKPQCPKCHRSTNWNHRSVSKEYASKFKCWEQWWQCDCGHITGELV